jgi:hypothetical protein
MVAHGKDQRAARLRESPTRARGALTCPESRGQLPVSGNWPLISYFAWAVQDLNL